MKRWIALLLALLLAFCCSGCRSGQEDSDFSDAIEADGGELSALPPEVWQREDPEEDKSPAELPARQIVWGPGKETDEAGRPVACVRLQEKYGKYNAFFLLEQTEQICLTFDEGYENGYTAAILDTLRGKNVSAVFFVTMDYVKKEPELVERMIQEGHQLGNHSTHHPNMTGLSEEQARKEVLQLHEYVQETFGYRMTLFRAPEGAISERSMAIVKSLGYQNVLWSFAYRDWSPQQQPEAADALKKLTERCHPGAIYLLHAVSKTNAQILGDFIDAVRSRGYEFRAL